MPMATARKSASRLLRSPSDVVDNRPIYHLGRSARIFFSDIEFVENYGGYTYQPGKLNYINKPVCQFFVVAI